MGRYLLREDILGCLTACLVGFSTRAVKAIHRVRRRGRACTEQDPDLPTLLVY